MNRIFTSYQYELKKLLFVRKGWVLLLGIFLLQTAMALLINPSQEYVFDKELYAEYVELFGGEYSDETAQSIEGELQSAEKIVNETDLTLITNAEEIEVLSEQMILASMKRNVLSALQTKYTKLSECKEYHPILTYDLEFTEYIAKYGINWASLIGMLFIIPMLMLGDRNCGMEQILFPTSTGRKNIVSLKLLVAMTVSLCITTVCIVIQSFVIGIRWDFGLLNVPIQSILGFEKCQINGTVLKCMIVCSVIQIFSAVSLSMIICILSSLLKKEPAIISATVILILISAFFAEKFSSASMIFIFSAMSGISSIKTYSIIQLLLSGLILLLKTAIFAIVAKLLANSKQ